MSSNLASRRLNPEWTLCAARRTLPPHQNWGQTAGREAGGI